MKERTKALCRRALLLVTLAAGLLIVEALPAAAQTKGKAARRGLVARRSNVARQGLAASKDTVASKDTIPQKDTIVIVADTTLPVSAPLPIELGDSVSPTDSSEVLPINEALQDGSFSTKAELRELVEAWNASLTPANVGRLSNIYYKGEVLYYGGRTSPEECINDKRAYMESHPGYSQELAGEIVYDSINQVTYRCSFVKRVRQNDGFFEYPSYLVMMRMPEGWRITAEGDGATDYNRKKNEFGGTRGSGMSEGDFNGTGTKGYVWLEPPVFAKADGEEAECLGGCDGTIRFLNPFIPPIKVRHCIDGTPDNLGDLNGDGADEIGLLPIWFNGCWADYHVWTLQGGRWIEAIESFPTHCDQWKTGLKPVEIDPKHPGHVIIRYSESGKDGGITVKTKSVPIRGGNGAAPKDSIMFPKK